MGDGPRERYLRAGAGLLAGGGLPYEEVLSGIRMTAVLHRAGISRSALYRLWGSERILWADAVEYLLATSPEPLEGVAVHELGWLAALDAAEEAMRGDPLPALMTALVPYTRPPEVTALMRWRIDRAVRAMHRIVLWGQVTGQWALGEVSSRKVAEALYAVAAGLARAGGVSAAIAARDMPVAEGQHGRLAFTGDVVARRLGRPAAVDVGELGADADKLAGGAPPSRRATSERQDQVLDLIGRMLADDPRDDAGRSGGPLRHVTVQRVARAEQVSHQAVRAVWGTQSQYTRDLIAWLVEGENRAWLEAAAAALDKMPFMTPREMCEAVLVQMREAVSSGPLAAWAAAAQIGGPWYRELAGAKTEQLIADFAALYREKVLSRVARIEHPLRPRAGGISEQALTDFARILIPAYGAAAWIGTIDRGFNAATRQSGGPAASPISLVMEALCLDMTQPQPERRVVDPLPRPD